MPLICKLRNPTRIPVEVDTIKLEDIRELAAADVANLLVQYGNAQEPLGDFFDVSGSAIEDNCMVWQGDCKQVKLIGSCMSSGTVRVEGDAGMHLGAEMTGGEVICNGNSGDWVGAELHGGTITVTGNAGHLVGAVYRGGPKGMTGGRILIHGNAGNEIGHSMRRGLIAVGGSSGDAPGFNMIAGTIVLCGAAGIRPGAGMKRGSIVYLGRDKAPQLLPTFRASGEWSPEFLLPIVKELQTAGFPISSDALQSVFTRHVGDFLELGKGEILVR
jgi:formylmethanofuran dehydrogenase subunit C